MLLLQLAPVLTSQTLQECIDQAEDHFGEPPTCTQYDGGGYVASWPNDGFGTGGDGFGALFAVFFVLVVLIGVVGTVWKVSTARRLATASGMDPKIAGQMALLTDDGLESTYLASSLRGAAPTPGPTPPAVPASARERLAELKGLLDDGLITRAEHDERRRAVIDAL
ncbi:hypothetical protein IFT73_13500 [Aeromicrobium sp. CFBP 8757]|uniref:hypothetical protein n=1 Tax=Aeromicrobium sp. CFBP 8757 TaxID=2775288 RepID=UPI001786423D|nr:hypothetical protein [Aeromicrobium sp. CFBP 8757]MBD8607872.1 hypothetical protein [Aeromicrobium sp. CFBP 8757]